MAEFTTHAPGTFTWPELATTDQKAGVAFYRALFGWDVNEMPMGPGETYSLLPMRGKSIGAASSLRPDERQNGVPAHWNSYVTVANVDDSAKKAESLGARLFAPPFDVMDAGRMAVLQDPTGAVFCVWQAGSSIGAQVVNGPGALSLNQLNTTDPEAAQRFYTDLFGWRFEEMQGGPRPYYGIYRGDTVNGGMMQLPPGQPAPPHWLVYFGIDDIDDAVIGEHLQPGASGIWQPTDRWDDEWSWDRTWS